MLPLLWTAVVLYRFLIAPGLWNLTGRLLLLITAHWLLITSPVAAATLTGTLIQPNGQPYRGQITFEPRDAPLVTSGGVVTQGKVTVQALADGSFSASLQAGRYRMTCIGIPGITLSVPDSSGSFVFTTLVTAGLAQAPDYVPPAGGVGDAIARTNGYWSGTLTGDLLVGERATFQDFRRSVPFGSVPEDDDSLTTYGFIKSTVDAYGDTIDDVLALPVPILTRTAWVKTGDRAGWWMFCPDSVTADNADDIRRPTAITTDVDPGRWEFVMGPGGGGGGGGVTSITLTQPAAGLTITGSGTAITSAGTRTFALANDLLALENLSGTGYPQRTATDTWSLSTTIPWSAIATTPTTLSGYGITDPVVLTSGSYANPAWITGLAWSKISSAPTTLSGYGITDPVVLTSGSYSNPAWMTGLAWSKITGTPTTRSGYGITDAEPTITAGTTGQYLRGDKTWQTLATVATSGSASDLGSGTLPVARGGTGSSSLSGYLKGNGTSAFTASASIPWSEVSSKPAIYIPAGFTADGGGSALTSGAVKGLKRAERSGTITGWSISLDTGTATVRVWKKAAGTSIPTVSDNINTSGLSISSGTHVSSSTVTDFTTTAVSAGDQIMYEISAVSGATWLSFHLEITAN